MLATLISAIKEPAAARKQQPFRRHQVGKVLKLTEAGSLSEEDLNALMEEVGDRESFQDTAAPAAAGVDYFALPEADLELFTGSERRSFDESEPDRNSFEGDNDSEGSLDECFQMPDDEELFAAVGDDSDCAAGDRASFTDDCCMKKCLSVVSTHAPGTESTLPSLGSFTKDTLPELGDSADGSDAESEDEYVVPRDTFQDRDIQTVDAIRELRAQLEQQSNKKVVQCFRGSKYKQAVDAPSVKEALFGELEDASAMPAGSATKAAKAMRCGTLSAGCFAEA